MQTKYVADDLGQDRPGAVLAIACNSNTLLRRPIRRSFFTKEKLFSR